ncbi:hypothetical protein [Devosia sp. 1566]|uniref:hypothetical protein n=1 Tax=Devosia sp. 1566 TaxID=2499144 RepID=UPI000FDC724E|nr:hypothetical protein [Devosia sp. 1566]
MRNRLHLCGEHGGSLGLEAASSEFVELIAQFIVLRGQVGADCIALDHGIADRGAGAALHRQRLRRDVLDSQLAIIVGCADSAFERTAGFRRLVDRCRVSAVALQTLILTAGLIGRG